MSKNVLIDLLPEKTQERLFARAQLTELSLSQIICHVDEPAVFIYFPVNGFISLVQRIDERPPLEVGMIGREGVLGSESLLGASRNSFGAIVQGNGSAWRIKVQDFLVEVKNCPEFRRVVDSYIAVRIGQLGLAAACEHFHEIGPRLAKWLLMSQDRAQSPTFLMTHEFISLMLGVRRVGVTTAAADFKRRGLIGYHRGEMKILNRSALKAGACTCYQKNRKIYSALIN